MTGRGKKEKGKRGEREAVELLCSYGWSARRGMSFLGEPDLITDFPMHVEVKYQETLNIYAAIRQAEKYIIDKKLGKDYSVFFRKNDGEWHIACQASVFLEYLNLSKDKQENEPETK